MEIHESLNIYTGICLQRKLDIEFTLINLKFRILEIRIRVFSTLLKLMDGIVYKFCWIGHKSVDMGPPKSKVSFGYLFHYMSLQKPYYLIFKNDISLKFKNSINSAFQLILRCKQALALEKLYIWSYSKYQVEFEIIWLEKLTLFCGGEKHHTLKAWLISCFFSPFVLIVWSKRA